jgi:nucleotide-binding universal stress UspA family protein
MAGESFRNSGEGICQLALDEKADLIVIGRRGMSAVKRLVMGSVSEYVVRNASVPCLVVQEKNGYS